ncbi:MAG: transcriptional repressor [Deltaproteobacteria bacterium]|nr:transcriptional repressor [Deltaproteobacteria bacterium]
MTIEEKIARLKEKGILLTIQRYAILEFLQGNKLHPTVEEIYQSLRGVYPAISRATVYNTLELFKQQGLIQEITIERDKVRYDYRIEPHHHFLCRRCGQVYDVEVKGCPIAERERVDGHKVEELRPYIIGICSECLKEGGDAGAA